MRPEGRVRVGLTRVSFDLTLPTLTVILMDQAGIALRREALPDPPSLPIADAEQVGRLAEGEVTGLHPCEDGQPPPLRVAHDQSAHPGCSTSRWRGHFY